MDKGRQADIEYLLRVIDNPYKSSGERQQAKESLKAIANETRLIKSMRESLIKATRAGRSEEVRDISEWVLKHSRYQNE